MTYSSPRKRIHTKTESKAGIAKYRPKEVISIMFFAWACTLYVVTSDTLKRASSVYIASTKLLLPWIWIAPLCLLAVGVRLIPSWTNQMRLIEDNSWIRNKASSAAHTLVWCWQAPSINQAGTAWRLRFNFGGLQSKAVWESRKEKLDRGEVCNVLWSIRPDQSGSQRDEPRPAQLTPVSLIHIKDLGRSRPWFQRGQG